MRKFMSAVMAVFLVLFFTGCGNSLKLENTASLLITFPKPEKGPSFYKSNDITYFDAMLLYEDTSDSEKLYSNQAVGGKITDLPLGNVKLTVKVFDKNYECIGKGSTSFTLKPGFNKVKMDIYLNNEAILPSYMPGSGPDNRCSSVAELRAAVAAVGKGQKSTGIYVGAEALSADPVDSFEIPEGVSVNLHFGEEDSESVTSIYSGITIKNYGNLTITNDSAGTLYFEDNGLVNSLGGTLTLNKIGFQEIQVSATEVNLNNTDFVHYYQEGNGLKTYARNRIYLENSSSLFLYGKNDADILANGSSNTIYVTRSCPENSAAVNESFDNNEWIKVEGVFVSSQENILEESPSVKSLLQKKVDLNDYVYPYNPIEFADRSEDYYIDENGNFKLTAADFDSMLNGTDSVYYLSPFVSFVPQERPSSPVQITRNLTIKTKPLKKAYWDEYESILNNEAMTVNLPLYSEIAGENSSNYLYTVTNGSTFHLENVMSSGMEAWTGLFNVNSGATLELVNTSISYETRSLYYIKNEGKTLLNNVSLTCMAPSTDYMEDIYSDNSGRLIFDGTNELTYGIYLGNTSQIELGKDFSISYDSDNFVQPIYLYIDSLTTDRQLILNKYNYSKVSLAFGVINKGAVTGSDLYAVTHDGYVQSLISTYSGFIAAINNGQKDIYLADDFPTDTTNTNLTPVTVSSGTLYITGFSQSSTVKPAINAANFNIAENGALLTVNEGAKLVLQNILLKNTSLTADTINSGSLINLVNVKGSLSADSVTFAGNTGNNMIKADSSSITNLENCYFSNLIDDNNKIVTTFEDISGYNAATSSAPFIYTAAGTTLNAISSHFYGNDVTGSSVNSSALEFSSSYETSSNVLLKACDFDLISGANLIFATDDNTANGKIVIEGISVSSNCSTSHDLYSKCSVKIDGSITMPNGICMYCDYNWYYAEFERGENLSVTDKIPFSYSDGFYKAASNNPYVFTNDNAATAVHAKDYLDYQDTSSHLGDDGIVYTLLNNTPIYLSTHDIYYWAIDRSLLSKAAPGTLKTLIKRIECFASTPVTLSYSSTGWMSITDDVTIVGNNNLTLYNTNSTNSGTHVKVNSYSGSVNISGTIIKSDGPIPLIIENTREVNISSCEFINNNTDSIYGLELKSGILNLELKEGTSNKILLSSDSYYLGTQLNLSNVEAVTGQGLQIFVDEAAELDKIKITGLEDFTLNEDYYLYSTNGELLNLNPDGTLSE